MRTTRTIAALGYLLATLAGCAPALPEPAPSTIPAPARSAAPVAAPPAAPSDQDSAAVSEAGDPDLAQDPGLAAALRLYAARDFTGAALALHSHNDSAARFFLAKALYHMGYRVASLPHFDALSADASSPFHGRALPWLVRLADELPDDGPILKAIGRYTPADIAAVAPREPASFRGSAYYYIGRAAYDRGRFDDAKAVLRSAPAGSRWSLQARFFEGMSLLRAGDNDAALDVLHVVAQSADKTDASGAPLEDAARLRDLAWLSVARLHYAAASRAQDGGETLAGRDKLEEALKIYAKLPETSEYRDDALLEEAWSELRLADFKQALASLDALSSDYLEITPEAHYVRVLLHFSRCDLKNASAAAEAFRRGYGVRAEEVEQLGRASDDEIRTGRVASVHMPAVVKSAMAQRDVKRRFELLGITKGEKELLASAPRALQNSPLGAEITRSIATAEEAASAKISAIIKARCERFVDESREEVAKSDAVDIEVQAVLGGSSKCRVRQ